MTKDLAKIQFGREANKYVTSNIHSSQIDLQSIIDFIEPQKNWKVLDIATGTGHLAVTLAPYVESVIATDITPEMIVETAKSITAKKLTNVTTDEVDVHQIPYSNNTFDLVTSRIAPHHFYDIEKAVSEMTRVTKSGGRIFIQDTVAPEEEKAAQVFNGIEKLRDPSHVRDLSITQWKEVLEDHHNTILKVKTKTKDWPLRWWTERMSTPEKNVRQIIKLLEQHYERYSNQIHMVREEPYPDSWEGRIDAWSIHPCNGYVLATKCEA